MEAPTTMPITLIIVILLTIAFLAFIAFLGIIVYKNFMQLNKYKQTFNNNTEKITKLEKQIAVQDTSINTENERYTKANLENTSSIRYAKRIQSAAFSQKEIGMYFEKFFIYTKPHTIVSGDFYKAAETEYYKIFALADCSGHGVPGGFLTMLGLTSLKESLSNHYYDENIDLGAILDEMRQFVKTSLKSQNNGIDNINDGMNITVCAFDKNGGNVRFAGANQNVYLYSDEQITAYNGNRMPIGWSFKEENPFNETLIPIKKGDILYITTDSLQNQFGGANNTKFSVKKLIAMFQQIGTKPIEEQKNIVADIVEQWVEGYVQIDDLTVIGIQI